MVSMNTLSKGTYNLKKREHGLLNKIVVGAVIAALPILFSMVVLEGGAAVLGRGKELGYSTLEVFEGEQPLHDVPKSPPSRIKSEIDDFFHYRIQSTQSFKLGNTVDPTTQPRRNDRWPWPKTPLSEKQIIYSNLKRAYYASKKIEQEINKLEILQNEETDLAVKEEYETNLEIYKGEKELTLNELRKYDIEHQASGGQGLKGIRDMEMKRQMRRMEMRSGFERPYAGLGRRSGGLTRTGGGSSLTRTDSSLTKTDSTSL